MDLNVETAYQVAPQTGYLESPRIDRLSQESKTLIIENYAKSGNLTDACVRAGVLPRLFRMHMNLDSTLMKELTEAREQICDKAEGHIVEHMSRPNNVVDRLAWLRAWRASRWNPQAQINVNVDVKQTESLSLKALSFVDTTATQVLPTTGRKADDTTVPTTDGKAP